MNLLVTGAAGFIGSNFVRYWLGRHREDRIVSLDALTYAGNPRNLEELDEESKSRHLLVQGEIGNLDLMVHILGRHRIDTVINFAAESHNSRAVLNPRIFFESNVLGTQGLVEACRRVGLFRFHHVSTCEVFGDLPLDSEESFDEEDPYRPRTPYNASKAGSDFVVRSYVETFGLPATISTCANNYGPYQFPEKLIPLFITHALEGRSLPLYRSSANRREWLHVGDHCAAIEAILERGTAGELYNIGSGVELSVEEVTDAILGELSLGPELKSYVPDRPGHDRRYLLNSDKIREQLGWRPRVAWQEGLSETVRWYRERRDWWEPLKKKQAVAEEGWSTSSP